MRRLMGALALAALAFIGYEPASECHANHCHGEDIKVCGGGWKRYKEPRDHVGPAAGADSADTACAAAVEELEQKLAAEALDWCTTLHPCATCPSECSGCAQDHPVGSIFDDKKTKKTPRQRADGRYECGLTVEAAFRCACGGCIKKSAQK